jgi:hypothetical protein
MPAAIASTIIASFCAFTRVLDARADTFIQPPPARVQGMPRPISGKTLMARLQAQRDNGRGRGGLRKRKTRTPRAPAAPHRSDDPARPRVMPRRSTPRSAAQF